MASPSPVFLSEDVYEARHVNLVKALCTSDVLSMCEPLIEGLSKKPWQQWAAEVSERTPVAVKSLLGGAEPPTVQALIDTLPAVGDCSDPGVYVDALLGKSGALIYVGSATSVGGGLRLRKHRHSDSDYRKTRGQAGNRHYQAIDDPEDPKTPNFRILLQDTFTSSKKEDLDELSIRNLLAETEYMIWLRGLAPWCSWNVNTKAYVELCPWPSASFTFEGTNGAIPLQQGGFTRKRDAPGIGYSDEKEYNAAWNRSLRVNYTEEQAEHEKKRKASYRKRAELPVKRMRREGRPEDEIKAFQQAAKAAMAETLPPLVHGRRYEWKSTEPRKTAVRARPDLRKYGDIPGTLAEKLSVQPTDEQKENRP